MASPFKFGLLCEDGVTECLTSSQCDGIGGGTCHAVHPSDPAVALLALDATAATVAKIGAGLDPTGRMSEADRLDLIRWIRGLDSFDADADGDTMAVTHSSGPSNGILTLNSNGSFTENPSFSGKHLLDVSRTRSLPFVSSFLPLFCA